MLRGSVDADTNPPVGTVTDIDISVAPMHPTHSEPLRIEFSLAQITRLNMNQIVTLLIEIEAGPGVGMDVITSVNGFPDLYHAFTIDITDAEFEDPINSTMHANIIMNELLP